MCKFEVSVVNFDLDDDLYVYSIKGFDLELLNDIKVFDFNIESNCIEIEFNDVEDVADFFECIILPNLKYSNLDFHLISFVKNLYLYELITLKQAISIFNIYLETGLK